MLALSLMNRKFNPVQKNFFENLALVKKQRINEMKKLYFRHTLMALALTVALASISGDWLLIAPASAGEIELTDIQNAKLARHRARERVMKNEKQEDYIDDGTPGPSELNDGDCGTVDIGNVINDKGFGGPKEIDVIITGDIINANNDCR